MPRKLTASEELKLIIIENFIDYYTSNDKEREEIKECAFDYVAEDHCNELEDHYANPNTIKIGIYQYIDEDGKKVYDFEEMADEFENELSKLDDSVVVMCSIE